MLLGFVDIFPRLPKSRIHMRLCVALSPGARRQNLKMKKTTIETGRDGEYLLTFNMLTFIHDLFLGVKSKEH